MPEACLLHVVIPLCSAYPIHSRPHNSSNGLEQARYSSNPETVSFKDRFVSDVKHRLLLRLEEFPFEK